MKPDQLSSDIARLASKYNNDVPRIRKALDDYEHIHLDKQRADRLADITYGDTIIELRDVIKSYKSGSQTIRAADNVNITIREREIVAIVGPSGSGKSTIMNIIGALDKPTSGTVIVDGVDIRTLSDGKLSRFRNKTVGFVFQFFYLQPFLSLRTNVEAPLMFARTPRAQRHALSDVAIDRVGLTDRASHLPKQLSGGQMQRAAIARAILNKPRILIGDEPTGNLDSKNAQSIMDEFERIRHEHGTTIVVVTHDEKIARRADRIIRMQDGKVV